MNILKRTPYLSAACITLCVAGMCVLYANNLALRETLAHERNAAQDTAAMLVQKIGNLEQRYTDSLDQLSLSQRERQDLEQDLEQARDKVDDIEDEYDRINDTVADLLKLENTDEELLQKYSRVYFLNENYIPTDLENIDSKYLTGSKALEIHAQVWPYLEEMLKEADDDGVDLRIISAYRSFEYQKQIKATYLTIYGSGANQFSADQGYSEHQLGTTVDFTTPKNGSSLSLFEGTPEFEWLADHAHKYGFVLSYPSGNNFYQYEPWHWRFVGTDLARELDRKDLYFYDMNQRDINQYLLEIFD